MYITTNSCFIAKHFLVHTFYGERTYFCWNEDKLVILPYRNDDLTSVEVLTAPAPIRTIQCFSGRIFLICIPQGIYKLSRHREFAVLSKSAVGMGTIFYEVLIPRNKYLYLDNKQKMTNKILFQLSSEVCDSSKLCICSLNVNSIEEHFVKALTNDTTATENLCVISDGMKLFTLINETVQIIYSSINFIRDIVLVRKNDRVAGLLLLTSVDVVIIMYSKDNELIFEKICLGICTQAICAGFSELTENTLWIVYSDESKLYYAKKELLSDNVQQIKVREKSFVCLQNYDSEIILGLTEGKHLIELYIDEVERTLSQQNDTFINLHPNMLKGTSFVMDKIYQGSQKLHSLNLELMTEEEKLRQINLYAHKRKAQMCFKVVVNRTVNQLFLSANLHNELPKNSWVTFNVRSKCRRIFCMKKVAESDIILDLQIPETLASNFAQAMIDLIILKDEGHPWCLIRNYMVDHCSDKRKGTRASDSNFINSKIAVLEDFIKEGNLNMKTLLEIKKKLRNKFSDV